MTVFATFSGFFSLFALCICFHPIHVSVTEIDFDEKEKTLEIMMRVFMDDFELTLRNELQKPDLDIMRPAKGTSVDELARQYLKGHFSVSLDGQVQSMRYLGHEREAEAFIFYIEVTDVRPWKTIAIHNDIIMSTYDDQSNIIHVFRNDDVKSLRLTRNTPADKLTFE